MLLIKTMEPGSTYWSKLKFFCLVSDYCCCLGVCLLILLLRWLQTSNYFSVESFTNIHKLSHAAKVFTKSNSKGTKKKAPSHTHKHVFADWRSVLRSHNRFFKRKWQKINLPNTEHLKYSNVLQNQSFNVSSTGNRFEVCQKQREFWNIHTSHAKTKEGSSISHYEHFKVPYYSSYIRNIWPLKDLSP